MSAAFAVVAAASKVAREEIVVQHDFFSVVVGVCPCAPQATSMVKTNGMMRSSLELILVVPPCANSHYDHTTQEVDRDENNRSVIS